MKKFESTYDKITRESEAKGKAQGERTGAANLLQTLLRRRFGAIPEATMARIASGSRQDLDRWADRVFDAKTLDDLFVD